MRTAPAPRAGARCLSEFLYGKAGFIFILMLMRIMHSLDFICFLSKQKILFLR